MQLRWLIKKHECSLLWDSPEQVTQHSAEHKPVLQYRWDHAG